jgi:hypothetical protein
VGNPHYVSPVTYTESRILILLLQGLSKQSAASTDADRRPHRREHAGVCSCCGSSNVGLGDLAHGARVNDDADWIALDVVLYPPNCQRTSGVNADYDELRRARIADINECTPI